MPPRRRTAKCLADNAPEGQANGSSNHQTRGGRVGLRRTAGRQLKAGLENAGKLPKSDGIFSDGRKYVSYNKATLRPLKFPARCFPNSALFPPVRPNLGSVNSVSNIPRRVCPVFVSTVILDKDPAFL